MAPSNMEFEYTHKKFNCGYSHKKLGMRLVRRDSQEEMEQEVSNNNNHMDINCTQEERTSSPTLFRPYALDEDETSNSSSNFNEEEMHHHHQQQSSMTPEEQLAHYFAQHYSQQQSADAYALKLQRQRAALYMKHVMQFYENGNGWPSVHPNALNQGMMTYNTNTHHC